ncbi:MAG TPA: 50S ribosomal protein L9 [Chloroflexia bacterium]|nr:50S ribosomal protein L9 [Chloroflexia bacterium]
MKVILTENVQHLGEAGTVQEVKNGYARNYLLPRGLAKPATAGMVKQIEQQHAAEMKRVAKAEEENRSLANQIEQQTIRLTARVGSQGRLYGSITSAQIAEALSAKIGQEVDRRKVEMPENIHTVGEYEVPVRLVGRLAPKVKVIVEAEGEPEAPAAPAATETTADVSEESAS